MSNDEQRGYERGLREAALAVNNVRDKLPQDRNPDGSWNYSGALFHPECRKIWWECRQVILDLLPERKDQVNE